MLKKFILDKKFQKIISAITFLLIFGSIFWVLFKNKKIDLRLKNEDKFKKNKVLDPKIFLITGFIAYFIQNLFVFDTPAPLIVFYFSLGLVYFVVRKDKKKDKVKNIKKQKENNSFPFPVFIVLAILFLIISIYNFNLQPFKSSRLGVMAVNASKKDLKLGFNYFKKSLNYSNFTNLEIRRELAKIVTKEYTKKDLNPHVLGPMTEFTISEYKKSIKTYPKDARVYLYFGKIYNLASRYNKDYIKEAKEVLEKGLEFSPKRQQIYFELANSYIIEGDYKKGLEIYKQAVELEPNAKRAQATFKKLIKAVQKKDPDLVKPYKDYLNSL